MIIVIILYKKLTSIMQGQPQSQSPQLQQKSRKNKYQFNLQRNRKILIQSDFDNGNISLVKQVTQLQYRLQAVSDFKSASPKKTWFHFRISGPKAIRIRLIIENVSIYENMYEDKDWARPVMNDGNGWRDVKDSFLTYRGEVGIVIDHTFINESFVYFALTVPHSYQDSENYLKQLAYKIPDHIHYEDEIIGKSWGGLNLHLLRLTAKQEHHRHKQLNSSSSHLISLQNQMNEKKSNPRIHSEASIDKYLVHGNHIKKPIILITSRVHPGEVGSTYCMMGMIDFLTRFSNLQSYLILRMFEVMIIPIVNPDGVFDGNYRMDLNNNNLNRVYQDPNPQLHPTVHRIKQLVASLINPNIGNSNWPKDKAERLLNIISRKIMFHFDLHSHSCNKSAFIYGNAFDQIVTQTQSQLYCKLLQENCSTFRYSSSHFGEKHMKMKDKGEPLTKQGCARVVISKMANVIYSYTVQTAIFPYLNKQEINPENNTDFKLSQQFGYEETRVEELANKYNIKNQLVLDNFILGQSIIVTILDILEKNPYSRFANLQETLDNYRKEISQSLLQSEERFKLLDIKAYQKVRNITKCCRDQITSKNQKHWDYLSHDKTIIQAKWPSYFKMFQHSPPNQIEMFRRKNRTKTEISESQRQINDFINPKNVRKRYLNMQIETVGHIQSEPKTKNQISPTKSMISPRNIQIQLDVSPTLNGPSLPQIRSAVERTVLHKNRVNSNSLSKHQAIGSSAQELEQKKQIQFQLKQMRELKQLQKKQSTKNIVLSFIHEQMQKMNTMRKNVQKSMAVQNRLASYKLIKKSSRSSSKIINQLGTVSMSANRYGIILNTNSLSTNPQQNTINTMNAMNAINVINTGTGVESSGGGMGMVGSKSKKKLGAVETCEEIINRRKNHAAIKEDQEQEEYEEEEGIYYVQQDKDKQEERYSETDRVKYNDNKVIGHKILPQKMPSSLEKISQYPIYTGEKQKQISTVVVASKRELAKVKYSEIKKKNIIRQDLTSNNNFKLPQLKGVNASAKNTGTDQQQQPNLKSNRNGVSINVNLNLNLNVCIEREFQGRARAATMPDEC